MRTPNVSIAFVCLLLLFSHEAKGEGGAGERQRDRSGASQTARKSCAGNWRPDSLPGKCFGLTKSTEFPEYKDRQVNSSQACRRMCCDMDDKCITWQYEKNSKACHLGAQVRLGFEGGGFPNWCEPFEPAKWNGRRVASRDAATGTCTWGQEERQQCFGLGPEKFKADGKTKLNTKECEEACCAATKPGEVCQMYQEIPGRGCFYGHDEPTQAIFCEKAEKMPSYEGGRKCVQGHCGGKEEEFLVPYLKKQKGGGGGGGGVGGSGGEGGKLRRNLRKKAKFGLSLASELKVEQQEHEQEQEQQAQG